MIKPVVKPFCGMAYTLEYAQRMRQKKDKDKHPQVRDEFIRPMWISLEERKKLTEK